MKKVLQCVIISLLIINSALANEISTALKFVKQPWNVINYNIKLNIAKPETRYFEGVCNISIRQDTIKPDNKFFFHLTGLQIKQCLLNGQLADYGTGTDSLGSPYYFINLSNTPDSNLTLTINYNGTAKEEAGGNQWGGVHFQNNILFNLGVGFNHPNVSAGSFWFPCYDHPSDKATYRIEATVPDTIFFAACGKLLETAKGDSNTKKFIWQGDVPAATYMIAFAAAKFDSLIIPNTPVPNIIYYPTSQENKAKGAFMRLSKMLECFIKYYGDYPFEKVGYVLTPMGSMEHQSLISLAYNSITSSDSLTVIPAHELAHSWFGGSVTAIDFRHVWFKEAFATFSEALWIEYLTSNDTTAPKLQYNRKLFYNAGNFLQSSYYERIAPLYDYPRKKLTNYPRFIYDKGAVVVNMLREELGDSLFFGAVKNFLQEYRISYMTTELLKKSIEQYTKKDLTLFFDQWIYGTCYPQLQISINKKVYPDGQYCKIAINTKQVQGDECTKFKKFYIDAAFFRNKEIIADKKIIFNDENETVIIDSLPNYDVCDFNYGRASVSIYKVMSVNSDVQEIATENTENYRLYPETAHDFIKIYGPGTTEPISIYNLLGEMVLFQEFANSVNISDLQNGIYVMKIGSRYYKFMKY